MTRWTRSKLDQRCGLCGHPIRMGAPVFEIVLAQLKRPLVRCGGCAWSPVPPDLPADIVKHETTTRMESVKGVATRATADFKNRQHGDES